MATKVALTAEEFRENSQRSIDLFNTEKLSTDSTHVLKSAYCNSVHFCRCNLHGACGGKADRGSSQKCCGACCNLHGACGGKVLIANARTGTNGCNLHGACGGKDPSVRCFPAHPVAICTGRVEAKRTRIEAALEDTRCNLHGACGGKGPAFSKSRHALRVAICTGRVEAKINFVGTRR